jgi:hypothetical protein
MNTTVASRRKLPGSGASPLILALSAARATTGAKLDGKLLKLCAEMEIRQAAVVRVDQHSKITDEEADVILDHWWETVEAITGTPGSHSR